MYINPIDVRDKINANFFLVCTSQYVDNIYFDDILRKTNSAPKATEQWSQIQKVWFDTENK